MPIRLSQHPFIAATQTRADAYAQWSGSSLVYSYYGGPHQYMLLDLVSRLEERGFSRWSKDYPGAFFHLNDGRGHGGGFSGACCYYGTMPLLVSIRFYNHGVELHMLRADTREGTVHMGGLIFSARVTNARTAPACELEYEEEAHFENILK